MLNKELKNEFTEETYQGSVTKANVKAKFASSIGVAEDKLNKDLYEFSKEEIIQFLRDPESGIFSTLVAALPIMRKYAQYIEKKLGVRNEYLIATLDIPELRRVAEEKIDYENSLAVTRDEILAVCEMLKNPRDKAVILGIYEGIAGQKLNDFLEIRPEDVQDNYIYLISRDIRFPASPQLIQYFRDAMREERYEYLATEKSRSLELVDGDKMALKTPKSIDPHRALRSSITRAANLSWLGQEMTLTNLKYSGMAHKVIEEMDKSQISLKRAYNAIRGRLLEEYGLERINRKKLLGVTEVLLKRRDEPHE